MTKNKKQFGIWMDSHIATIVGRKNITEGDFAILEVVNTPGASGSSNEHASNNQQANSAQKFFKEIAGIMPNVDELHVTGTGQVQEQFIKFLAETPQYKNVVCSESTSNKMSNENLLAFITKHFN